MTRQRIELVDFSRGIALIAMAVFHFAFDLQLLGFKEPGFIEQPHWKYFARSIATSFLMLTGFSLYLAHANGIRWKGWRWRMLKIVLAALLITVATYFATPGQYIFFGILHQIALASVIGLLFLRLPWGVTFGVGICVFLLGMYGRTDFLNAPYWLWTGLSEIRPNSSDYVPVFPWTSAVLLGMAFAKLCEQKNWLAVLARPDLEQGGARWLKFIGRHSLVFYLLHQPVMIGLIIGFSWLVGWQVF